MEIFLPFLYTVVMWALGYKHAHGIEIPAEEVVIFAVVSSWVVSLWMLPLFEYTDLGS